jgi:hypothetical protein
MRGVEVNTYQQMVAKLAGKICSNASITTSRDGWSLAHLLLRCDDNLLENLDRCFPIPIQQRVWLFRETDEAGEGTSLGGELFPNVIDKTFVENLLGSLAKPQIAVAWQDDVAHWGGDLRVHCPALHFLKLLTTAIEIVEPLVTSLQIMSLNENNLKKWSFT